MNTRLLLLAFGAVLPAVMSACAGGEDDESSPRPCVVQGNLLDAETGKPVSRRTIYMHFNCDELGYKESPTPRDTTDFKVQMPGSKVRIRAYDAEQIYAPFVGTFEAKDGILAVDIQLEPTHYALLRGRFEDGVTGRSYVDMKQSGQWMGLRLSIHDDKGAVHKGHIVPNLAGQFGVRVPRKRLQLFTSNTSAVPEQDTLDLSAFEGDAYDIVIRMVNPKED